MLAYGSYRSQYTSTVTSTILNLYKFKLVSNLNHSNNNYKSFINLLQTNCIGIYF